MGFFDFLKPADIGRGVEQYRETPGAVLIDVREADEYAAGHIPGAVNVPLSALTGIAAAAPDKNSPLFVYCLSGGRSSQAVSALKSAGYVSVTNIGGIGAYRGEIER